MIVSKGFNWPDITSVYAFKVSGGFRDVRYALEVLDRERSVYMVASLVRKADGVWTARVIEIK